MEPTTETPKRVFVPISLRECVECGALGCRRRSCWDEEPDRDEG